MNARRRCHTAAGGHFQLERYMSVLFQTSLMRPLYVFVLTHIALPSPDDKKKKIMYRLTLHGELKSVRDYFPKT